MPLFDEWNSNMLGSVQSCQSVTTLPDRRPEWAVQGVLVGISHDWSADHGVVTTLTFRVGENIVQVVAP